MRFVVPQMRYGLAHCLFVLLRDSEQFASVALCLSRGCQRVPEFLVPLLDCSDICHAYLLLVLGGHGAKVKGYDSVDVFPL